MVEQLNAVVDTLHPVLQVLAVVVIGIVPFLESYVGAGVGALAGMPVVLAVTAAVVGNLLALAVAVWLGDRARRGLTRGGEKPQSERRRKLIARVDRYGVPVASLLAPTLMAISLTAFAMVAAGLDRRQVVVWQTVTVVVWGVLFGALGLGALSALG
ncbi:MULTISPECIES: hypothetical protein [unclassified Pseudonocardia]|uniref:hypothetical protein n=1 Tax=unclassified Pseudonocardia TaxID=2619320 RepID=UPI0001FFEADF|nr:MULTISPECIES: hypothetical protein [unclassified Pseudonocardia]ALE74472.1 hypothetical protein FRP1_18495 [Pseudonocardia sp. EC080625-04]ALL77893.1 hypothetical protein AD006_25945 [Pseudonocardia sp. EC080610-09]ALL80807.1 hypothetical protein AD017_05540 [Pseudonocardia sp. EC080619-01]OLM17223.1 hypothetical protein Ae707Ps1_1482c [Pseudonocardia sp. Ae707_Ps1]